MTKIPGKTLFIINPRAGNGTAGRKTEEIETLAGNFFSAHRTLVTDGPGRATEYARQSLKSGFGHVVCVGGDGTLNEVVNGLTSLKVEKNRRPKLGYLPCGTGSDLAKTLGIPDNIEKGLRNIATNPGQWVDLGRATFIGHDERTASRYFVNVLSFALGGEVVGRVNRSNKVLGGFLTFLWATLAALVSYEKPLIRLRIDGKVDKWMVCLHVAIANGQVPGRRDADRPRRQNR